MFYLFNVDSTRYFIVHYFVYFHLESDVPLGETSLHIMSMPDNGKSDNTEFLASKYYRAYIRRFKLST